MFKCILVKIKNKIATLIDPEQYIVCGNSDYSIQFEFDDDWNDYPIKTVRLVLSNGEYIDRIFEGNVCKIPAVYDVSSCRIGVIAGEIRTTTPAFIKCKPCITDGAGTPAPPKEDVYAQLMTVANETKAVAESVRKDADNGEFNPVLGVDYFTEKDKQEIVDSVLDSLPNGDEVSY